MVFDIVKREKHETLLRIVPREGRFGFCVLAAPSGQPWGLRECGASKSSLSKSMH
jgi:hypothetical protein